MLINVNLQHIFVTVSLSLKETVSSPHSGAQYLSK